MAIRITPGYVFEQFGLVTPGRLNALVDNAHVDQIPASDVFGASNPSKAFTYGGSTPALVAGAVHYDTTPGFEGAKFAFVSASNGSVSKWLYRAPHFDMVFWAVSGATLGVPQVMAAHFRPIAFKIFDGHMFPYIIPLSNVASGPSLLDALQVVIPTESVVADKPCICAIRGLVSGSFVENLTSGVVYLSSYSPTNFKTGNPSPSPNRSLIVGHCAAPIGGVPGITLPSWLLYGPAYQDSKIS